MTAINNKVRNEIECLVKEELMMVDSRARILAESHWREAEQEVARDLGYGDTLIQIECLKAQIDGLQTELIQLEGSVLEKAHLATINEYCDCGIEVQSDRYGHIYSMPIIFGREIKTSWDIKVLQHLNESLSFF